MKPLYENEREIISYFINNCNRNSKNIHSVLDKYSLSKEDKEFVDNFIKQKEILAYNKGNDLGIYTTRKEIKTVLQTLTNLADVEGD